MFDAESEKSSGYSARTWQLQEAQASFCDLIHSLDKYNVQAITENGKEIAYIVSKSKFEELIAPKESLVDFFLRSPHPDIELNLDRDKIGDKES